MYRKISKIIVISFCSIVLSSCGRAQATEEIPVLTPEQVISEDISVSDSLSQGENDTKETKEENQVSEVEEPVDPLFDEDDEDFLIDLEKRFLNREEVELTKAMARLVNMPGHEENAKACKLIAIVYAKRDNFDKTVEWFKRSSDLGDAESTYELALLYNDNLRWVDVEPQEVISLYDQAADNHIGPAARELGVKYLNGNEELGVDQDTARGIKYLQQAIEYGSAEADIDMAAMKYEGYCVDKDQEGAIELFNKAAQNENIYEEYISEYSSLDLLYDYAGTYLLERNDIAVPILEALVSVDHVDAKYDLGQIYLNGTFGKEKDSKKAVEYFVQAAEGGNSKAMSDLAVIYQNGIDGVELDTNKATEYMLQAADAGVPDFEVDAGNYYASIGDYEKAVEYYQAGAASVKKRAMWGLGVLYEMGYGVEQDLDEATTWIEKAKKLGYNSEKCDTELGKIKALQNH